MKKLMEMLFGKRHEWRYEHPEKRRCAACGLKQHVYYSAMDGVRLGWVNDNLETYSGGSCDRFACGDEVLEHYLKTSRDEVLRRDGERARKLNDYHEGLQRGESFQQTGS